MGLQAIERAIRLEAQEILCNRELRNKDIREWSTSEKVVRDNQEKDEIVIHLPEINVWICVFDTCDKREEQGDGK